MFNSISSLGTKSNNFIPYYGLTVILYLIITVLFSPSVSAEDSTRKPIAVAVEISTRASIVQFLEEGVPVDSVARTLPMPKNEAAALVKWINSDEGRKHFNPMDVDFLTSHHFPWSKYFGGDVIHAPDSNKQSD